MKELLEKLLTEDHLDDVLQPYSVEEFVQKRLKAGRCTLNDDGTYSCEGDVNLCELGLKKLPVKFREVEGSFACSKNHLTSLEGAPKYVGGGFDCHNNQLTSLEGAPEYVGGYFDCASNPVSVEELHRTIKRDYLT